MHHYDCRISEAFVGLAKISAVHTSRATWLVLGRSQQSDLVWYALVAVYRKVGGRAFAIKVFSHSFKKGISMFRKTSFHSSSFSSFWSCLFYFCVRNVHDGRRGRRGGVQGLAGLPLAALTSSGAMRTSGNVREKRRAVPSRIVLQTQCLLTCGSSASPPIATA